jgi:four helix bundle protein
MVSTQSTNTLEDLEVWKLSRKLRIELVELARRLPSEEKYRLTDQLIRAARSITNNIAEGYGRFHFPGKHAVSQA